MLEVIPAWAWVLIITNVITAIATIASVKVDVFHALKGVDEAKRMASEGISEAKSIATRAHDRIDHMQSCKT